MEESKNPTPILRGSVSAETPDSESTIRIEDITERLMSQLIDSPEMKQQLESFEKVKEEASFDKTLELALRGLVTHAASNDKGLELILSLVGGTLDLKKAMKAGVDVSSLP